MMLKGVCKSLVTVPAALMLPGLLLCQQPAVKTTISGSEILLGQQFKLKIKAAVPLNEYTVSWFELSDTIAHFEVVDPGKLDTTGSGGETMLEQTITLTSFDSGSWATPAFTIACKRISDGNTTLLYADSMPVHVAFAADTSRSIRDIKPIFDVESKWPVWYYYAIAGIVLVVVLLALLLYRSLSIRAGRSIAGGALPPYEEAVKSLKALQYPAADQPAAVKAYYTALSTILKKFISRKTGVNITASTTSELLVFVRSNLPGVDTAQLAALLRMSDAVKFARYMPGAPAFGDAQQQALLIAAQAEKTSTAKA